jgi:hypothetical protein
MTKSGLVIVIMALGIGMHAAGCSQIPSEALKFSQVDTAQRQVQSRLFDTTDEARLLQASAGVLRDMGFELEKSDVELGLIVGSLSIEKSTERMAAEQIAQVSTWIPVVGYFSMILEPIWNSKESLRVSAAIRQDSHDSTMVRVNFQIVTSDLVGVYKESKLYDRQDLYSRFFDNLSRAVTISMR